MWQFLLGAPYQVVGLRDSCLHFRYQLLGVPFTVRTDHSSLRWILSQSDLTAIRQRWLAVLSQFQMTEISHVAGKDNVVADALSRYPEMAGQSYDHLLPEEDEMDLLSASLFNILLEVLQVWGWTISVPPLRICHTLISLLPHLSRTRRRW